MGLRAQLQAHGPSHTVGTTNMCSPDPGPFLMPRRCWLQSSLSNEFTASVWSTAVTQAKGLCVGQSLTTCLQRKAKLYWVQSEGHDPRSDGWRSGPGQEAAVEKHRPGHNGRGTQGPPPLRTGLQGTAGSHQTLSRSVVIPSLEQTPHGADVLVFKDMGSFPVMRYHL